MATVEDPNSSPSPIVGTVRNAFILGLAWKLAGQIGLQLMRIGVTVALARLLAPHDYGIAAMALVLASFVIAFSDVGLGAALVQRSDLTEADRSTAFWSSVLLGLIFTLATFALAGPIASFYGHQQVRPLIAALSPVFLINSLSATHRALLAKEMNFRALELRTFAAVFLGGGACIAVAAEGYGPWALIVQELVAGTVSTLLLWMLSPWHPSPTFNPASFRRLVGFGSRTVAARVLSDINETADNILVGRYLGSVVLGFYAIGYKAVLAPVGRLVMPIQEVLFPALSRLQGDSRRMGEAWLRTVRMCCAIVVPTLAGLAVVAPDFVEVVLGRRWEKTARLLQLLAVVAVVQSLQATYWSILTAKGRTAELLRLTLLSTTANFAAFALGLRWGIYGVATCYAVSSAAVFIVYTLVTLHLVGIRPVNFLRALSGVIQATAGMGVVVAALRAFSISSDVSSHLRLFPLVVAGILVFAGLLAWRDRPLVTEALALLPRRRRHPGPLAKAGLETR